MTLPPNFLDSYIQLLTRHRISESGTIACRADCYICPLLQKSDGSCGITIVADTFNLHYAEFETSIIHPLVAQTHPELLL